MADRAPAPNATDPQIAAQTKMAAERREEFDREKTSVISKLCRRGREDVQRRPRNVGAREGGRRLFELRTLWPLSLGFLGGAARRIACFSAPAEESAISPVSLEPAGECSQTVSRDDECSG
jgi:hypothetical protein